MGLVVSMTGYGRGEARGVRTVLVAEARSLNHRFFEASVKLPSSAAWCRGASPGAGWT